MPHRFFAVIALCLVLGGCNGTSKRLIGKWQVPMLHEQKPATLEFFTDGKYSLDFDVPKKNITCHFEGTYQLSEGTISMHVNPPGESNELTSFMNSLAHAMLAMAAPKAVWDVDGAQYKFEGSDTIVITSPDGEVLKLNRVK